MKNSLVKNRNMCLCNALEAALEEEKTSDKLVLFPIRLDDTPFNIRDGWMAKIKRTRNIGDFSNWKDEGSCQNAFERLLSDLKAGGDVNGESRAG